VGHAGNATDLFDQAQQHLTSKSEDQAPHPVLVIDDAEGMSLEILDSPSADGVRARQRGSLLGAAHRHG
jgi:hypothetical protein